MRQGCIFEYIFVTTTHQVTKLGILVDISKGNNFLESFEPFGRLGLSSRSPFPFSNLLQLLSNQLCQDSSVSFFEKVNKGHLKMINVNF